MSGPATEIERKFLVVTPPSFARGAGKRIEQGYLAVEEAGTEVRLRTKGDRLFLTVKRGAGLERLEAETEIDKKQFDDLWPMTAGRRLTKVRHEIEPGDLTIEVDVYEGGLAGLVVAEVEFPTRARSEEFQPPAWFGEDVTGDERYMNQNLAK